MLTDPAVLLRPGFVNAAEPRPEGGSRSLAGSRTQLGLIPEPDLKLDSIVDMPDAKDFSHRETGITDYQGIARRVPSPGPSKTAFRKARSVPQK